MLLTWLNDFIFVDEKRSILRIFHWVLCFAISYFIDLREEGKSLGFASDFRYKKYKKILKK